MSLLQLPNEILLSICKELSLQKDPTSDLGSISQTCRRLYSLANPVLYQNVTIRKVLRFLRTIRARPDLAALVRHFSCNRPFVVDHGPSEKEIEELRAQAESLKVAEYDHIRKNGFYYDNFPERLLLHLRLLELMLAQLPNIKVLNVDMRTMYWYDAREPRLKPAAKMESLNSISLRLGPPVCDFASMENFLAMAPCIERLEMRSLHGAPKPLPVSRIRSLTIGDSTLDKKGLQTLIDSCPELEYFQHGYREQMTNARQFTWGQAQSVLHSRSATLKHFSLEVERYSDPHRPPLASDDYFGSFADFQKLETLRIRTIHFGKKDNQNRVPGFPADVDDLVAKLPQSLTSIGFYGPHEDWSGIRVLAGAVEMGYFPSLKKVTVEQEPEEFETSREILAACGIDYEGIPVRAPCWCWCCHQLGLRNNNIIVGNDDGDDNNDNIDDDNNDNIIDGHDNGDDNNDNIDDDHVDGNEDGNVNSHGPHHGLAWRPSRFIKEKLGRLIAWALA